MITAEHKKRITSKIVVKNMPMRQQKKWTALPRIPVTLVLYLLDKALIQ